MHKYYAALVTTADWHQWSKLRIVYCGGYPLPDVSAYPQLLYYSNNIFQAAGLSAHDAGIATVVSVGVVLVIVTFITVS